MKYKITIDPNREEEVLIFAHKRSEQLDRLEALLQEDPSHLTGFLDDEVVLLNPSDIVRISVEANKVYAYSAGKRYLMKLRLYQLEKLLGADFMKINQSSLANRKKIKKFDVSIGGTLKVIFQDGSTDYVSRRNMKSVKERFGF